MSAVEDLGSSTEIDVEDKTYKPLEEECSDSSEDKGTGKYTKKLTKRRQESNSTDSLEERSLLSQKPVQKKTEGCVQNFKFPHAKNLAIIEHLVPVFDKLMGPKNSKTESALKRKQWQKINNAVNAIGIAPRTEENIRKRYQGDIKGTIKKKLSIEKYVKICI